MISEGFIHSSCLRGTTFLTYLGVPFFTLRVEVFVGEKSRVWWSSPFPPDPLDENGLCEVDSKSNSQETKACVGSTCAALAELGP